MEATLTNSSYRYRAPIRYAVFAAVFLGIGGIAAFFFAVVSPWVFRAVILFLMAVSFLGGAGFLSVYLHSFSGHISFSQDSVILPYRYKRHPVVMAYSDITLSEEMHTYGRLLAITVADGRRYILDESWMQKGAFDEILELLRDKTGK